MTNEQEVLEPTYYVQHPDGSYSVAEIQPKAIRDQEAAKVAMLERQLADAKEEELRIHHEKREWMDRALEAEQRIAESRRQAPVAEYNWILGDWECTWNELFEPAEGMLLYPAPIVPFDVEEAVKAEREACADIASNHECGGEDDIICQGQNCGTCIAGSIRARSGK